MYKGVKSRDDILKHQKYHEMVVDGIDDVYKDVDKAVAIRYAYDLVKKEYYREENLIFENITMTDILFVMNETKEEIDGYIGAETFAELTFALMQNLVYNKNIQIVILRITSINVQSYEEINLWLKLGW